MEDKLLFGIGSCEITPSKATLMAGYAARQEPSQGVHDPLQAFVLQLALGSKRLVVVNVDLVEVPRPFVLELREAIAQAAGVPQDAVLIAATHTHSGPLVSDRFGSQQEQDVLDAIKEGVLGAAADAVPQQPVSLRWGEMQVPVGKNRRTLDPSPDQVLYCLGFYDGSELLGLMVNYPLHATVLGADNLLFSADFVGYLRQGLPSPALFLNGAAGNINIGYSADASALGETISFRNFATAEDVGRTLGAAALQALETGTEVDVSRLGAWEQDVLVPLKDLPTLQQLADDAAALRARADKAAADARRELLIQAIYRECVRDAMLRLEAEGKDELPLPVQALVLGEVALTALPLELFAELGLAIRALRPGRPTLVAGYSNGSMGYLPTENVLRESGYESETSPYDPTAGAALLSGIETFFAERAI